MKIIFYPRLALDGIRKNRQMYLPYILTCVGMVMMTYIVNYLRFAETIAAMRGGWAIQELMRIGFGVLVFFSAIFLFYTNSFLIRRRKKEFGLYNILGMGKRNIGCILFWESLYVAVCSVTAGLIGGIAFSKLAELGYVNLMKEEVTYTLTVSPDAIVTTLLPFGVIFLLLFFNALRQVWFSGAITLLRSENAGEKPPKANWLLGIAGVIVLGVAYYMAVTIQNALEAVTKFFIAVILVIAGTYLIMISGSVLFCRILQRNKKYYYKPNHFVSVSSMVYRMKRNGAGLASICILATMVLVMISSTSALFIGGEAVIRSRYPRDINMSFSAYGNRCVTEEERAVILDAVESVLGRHDVSPDNIEDYRTNVIAGKWNGGDVIFDQTTMSPVTMDIMADVHQIFMIPLEDYNRVTGSAVTLEPDGVLVFTPRTRFDGLTFGFTGLSTYRVKGHLEDCFPNSDAVMDIVPSALVITTDVEKMSEGLVSSAGSDLVYRKWIYSFDVSAEGEDEIAVFQELEQALYELKQNGWDTFSYKVESREYERKDFYSLYGGIFFLGIMLSVVFLFAAVLIIYYKQISEGCEDQARFGIMQKVGMTKRDIRRSVNSQLLTVFFLPLLGAGLHLVFAFPIIEELLLLFNLRNHWLFVGTTIGSYLVFALFYVIVYRITAGAYYRIVG